MSHYQPNALYLKKNQYKVSLKSFKKPLHMYDPPDDGFLEAETYVGAL
jgi:hypothetical protein